MSDLAWRFFVWMSKPSKLKGLAWRFFFWITPRWLSKKFQMYVLRSYVERYPGEMERKISAFLRASIPARAEALAPLLKLEAQQSRATRSEEELAALSKQFLDLMLHPQADAQSSSKSRHIRSAEKTMPIPLQLRENCLKDCLDELSKRFEVAFQRKGARLETEFEPSIPKFRFDYLKVQQAAANLLDHALRQAPASNTVTLRCLSRPDGAEVSLTGATEHDQKVFDNYPAPRSRPRKYQESLDVALTIAKRLVLAHGGRIWVEPSPTGSKFVFVLPRNAS